jgi:tricarballylate dehydrogenase
MVDFNRSWDVAVLGGGSAAMCAAITAAEAGCSVIVLEHGPRHMRGGNTRHTRNLRAMHRAPTDVLTDAYAEEEFWDDLRRVTAGETDEHLARLTITGSEEALPWMAAHGVRFQPALTGTLSLSRTNAFFLGGGKALLNAYYLAAERLAIDVLYDTEVRHLALEEGAVGGVHVVSRGFEQVVQARAVVAGSGGFQSNIEWMKQYWGEAAENFLIRGTPYNRGRVLRDLMDQGIGTVGDPTQCHAVAIDARGPKFDGGIVTRLDSVPFSIMLNTRGERFYDEGEDVWPKRYAIWGRLIGQQPGQIAYSIFDRKCVELFMPSVFPAYRADSIAELVARIGLPAETAAKSIEDYNAAVRPGTFNNQQLDDCRTEGLVPPKSHWAQRIDTPPFFAYPLRPGITFTYLGVRVNDRAQVLMQDGRPTANLFATGEIMAGNILGRGYLAGFGMTIGTVFGRIAGKEAARHVRN